MMMTKWFYSMREFSHRWCLRALEPTEGFDRRSWISKIKRASFTTFMFTLTVGGSLQGALIGAIRGCTTGIGFVPGFGFGAAAGAITAMELTHSLVAANNLLSGVEILYAHLAGKIYMGWLSEFENSYIGHIDSQGGNSCSRGLSQDHIQRLPEFKFHSANNITEHCCLICLEDCTDGDMMRKTPRCGHAFHLCCLDKWLTINGSCPLCRTCVSDYPTL